jgi:hypothetical protein
MATIAMFIALGGGAYAVTLTKNSVKAKHIARNAVRSSEIKAGAVGGSEVQGNAITGSAVNEGSLAKVPLAASADRATSAAAADSATDAGSLDGLDSAAFGRAGQAGTAGVRLIDQNNHDCTAEDGPSVTVSVGPSGLVAVYAEATMGAGSTDPGRQLRVQLHEPTALPGCETIMRETSVGSVARRTAPGGDVGTTARGSWLIYRVASGQRTFSLRYGHTGNGSGIFAVVQQRFLYVLPL